jgi:subtilisin family serine protease
VAYLEDFESGALDWTPGSSCPGACDAWGGFIDAFDNVWANDSDFMNEPLFYVPLVNAWITSPVLVLPALGPRLEFRIWHDLAPVFDVLAVELSTDGASWDIVGLLMGTSATDPPGTSPDPGGLFAADLSAYAGAPVLVRFRILSDASLQGDGVYIDDVSITRTDVFEFDGTQFRFGRGTSFSAPLVSGVAALMMSQQPALTHHEVRELLLSTVDPVPALAGRVASGGRLDARKALEAAIAAPEPAQGLLSIAGVATTLLLARLAKGRQDHGPVSPRTIWISTSCE